MALWSALIAGGVVVWFSPDRENTVSPQGGYSREEPALTVPDAADGSGLFGGLTPVGEVLRKEAAGATSQDRALVWRSLKECRGAGFPPVDWFAVDEALFWLRGATGAGSDIEEGFMDLGGNPTLPETLRCLALQHLGTWAEGRPLGVETIERLRAVTGEGAAGGAVAAALRVLHRVSPRVEDSEWLRTWILELVGKTDCHPEARVTALQIAVELGLGEVEPLARKLVDPRRPVAERVGAFLLLGRLGNGETLRWLNSLVLPSEQLVLEARNLALRHLSNH